MIVLVDRGEAAVAATRLLTAPPLPLLLFTAWPILCRQSRQAHGSALLSPAPLTTSSLVLLTVHRAPNNREGAA